MKRLVSLFILLACMATIVIVLSPKRYPSGNHYEERISPRIQGKESLCNYYSNIGLAEIQHIQAFLRTKNITSVLEQEHNSLWWCIPKERFSEIMAQLLTPKLLGGAVIVKQALRKKIYPPLAQSRQVEQNLNSELSQILQQFSSVSAANVRIYREKQPNQIEITVRLMGKTFPEQSYLKKSLSGILMSLFLGINAEQIHWAVVPRTSR